MHNYETLGAFYLGREIDSRSGKEGTEPLLYDSRDLTTHAVCVGMTGSGKTGLCISLLEEAALDGIPAIVIDPKGDLGNLLLAFPELRAADFEPWIDPGEAQRKGLTPAALAQETASTWKNGLAEWHEDGERIRRYRDAVDIAIYTPGSDKGRALSLLASFKAPAPETLNDASALRERISATVGGLLGFAGIDADPTQSREHILLSSAFAHRWSAATDVTFDSLIQDVQKPPFEKVGVLDLETFYPAKERVRLAIALNNLVASPGFSAWMQGEPLDIQNLLYTASGKPRLSVISIAHLNDAERMLVVTLVLSEAVAWMRKQAGTSSLRALIYMDEIFGYFPPSAMPPAKLPLLTLMKQARAFGVGVVLATQNPVDLDYKGLSNAGTWFIGRLQTERDKMRVVDGLLGADDAPLDKAELEQLLASLGKRVFLMRNVHDERPLLFRTRWTLSYLRGPLTLQEIARLQPKGSVDSPTQSRPASAAAATDARPAARKAVIPSEVPEYYWPTQKTAPLYRLHLLATAQLHFVDKKAGIDHWQKQQYLIDTRAHEAWDWSSAIALTGAVPAYERRPASDARFAAAPAELSNAASYSRFKKQLESYLQQHGSLTLYACEAARETSAPGENEAAFRARIALKLREQRDAQIDRLRAKYAERLQRLQDQRRRALDRVEREKAQLTDRKMQTALSIGTSVLGALFGRKRISMTNVGRVGSAARSAGRIGRDQQDVERAEESLEVLDQRYAELERELAQETAALQQNFDPSNAALEKLAIAPRKADLEISELAVVWKADD